MLEPYVLDLVNRTIEEYSKRYAFELKEPVVVELYPEHDDFAVRTSGLPGIGLLGVTFGYLVAMDSPTGRADSRFPLGHHALARDGARVHARGDEAPRAALVQRGRVGLRGVDHGSAAGPAHSAAGVQGDQGRTSFCPIAELDRGFIRPMYEAQVIVSYMQAGLTCEYIAARWGQQGLRAMLDQYARGQGDAGRRSRPRSTIAPEQFDKDFAGYVQSQLGTVGRESRAVAEGREGERSEAFVDKDWKSAARRPRRTRSSSFPSTSTRAARTSIKARAHRELGETALATATLLDYRKRGGHDPARAALAREVAARRESPRRPRSACSRTC